MKIQLKPNYIAILRNSEGETIGCFNSSDYADEKLMEAVRFHYDLSSVGLVTYRDFNQPLDYEQPYEFVLYLADGTEDYITLTMTYEKIY